MKFKLKIVLTTITIMIAVSGYFLWKIDYLERDILRIYQEKHEYKKSSIVYKDMMRGIIDIPSDDTIKNIAINADQKIKTYYRILVFTDFILIVSLFLFLYTYKEGVKNNLPKKQPVIYTIIDLFIFLNLSTVDKRQQGGCLWVIDSEHQLKPLMDLLKEKGIIFKFAEHGGTATNKIPAWWTKSKDTDLSSCNYIES